jgi:ABC-type bacteriocin/lantibiotic exporter with double-glycine peptidase domain
LHLQADELDQMVNFHFTESVFDIILLASFKTLIVFILVTELENATVKLATDRADIVLNVNISAVNTNAEIESLSDTENLVNQLNRADDSHVNVNLKLIRKFLNAFILILNLASLAYVAIKFSFILEAIIKNQSKNQNVAIVFNDDLTSSMNYFFFSILVVQFGFVIVETVFSCLSWVFFNKLAKEVMVKYYINNAINAPSSEENAKKQVNIARLISLSHPERFLIMIGFVMLIISSFTSIAVPYFFGLVVDAALKYADLVEMNKYITLFFTVFVIGSLAGGLRSWLFELAGQRVVARLRNSVFSSIIRQDIKFFDTNRTGELTSRISSDTQVLQNAITVNLSMLIRYILQIFGSIVFMFSLQASLTGLLLGVVPVLSLMTVQYGRYLSKLRKVFQDELAASSIVAEETISSVRTVRSFAAEQKLERDYNKNVNKSFLIGKKLAVATGGFMVFVGLLSAGALALILWYGGKLVHDKKISTGLLASFLMYTLQVAAGFAFITSLYGDFMQVNFFR